MDQGPSVKHIVYVGGNGRVRAFDCGGQNPRLLWNVELAGSGHGYVTTVGHLNHVYVGCGGQVFQIDGKTGKINWTKKLSRGINSHFSLLLNGSFLICGVLGYVSAVDKDAGHLIWETNLEGSGYKPVSLLLRPGQIIAGTCGRVFCLNALTGKIQWQNSLSGCGLQGLSLSFNHLIYVGCRGTLYSLSPTDGTVIGTNSLPNTGYEPVSQLWVGEHLLVATGQHLRKLDASGNELWKNDWSDYSLSDFNCINMKLLDNQLWIGHGTDLLRVDVATGGLSSIWKLNPPDRKSVV